MTKPKKISTAKKKGTSEKKAKGQKLGKQATATPAIAKDPDDIFGFLAGKITIVGDIVSPALSPREWGSLYPSQRSRRPRR
jgi:hypothetical protein